jgi:hypothetical protein
MSMLQTIEDPAEGAPEAGVRHESSGGKQAFEPWVRRFVMQRNPPAAARHSARLPPGIERGLWESRSTGEWQALKMQYPFNNVLVSAEWTLQLPVVRPARTPMGPATLYRIPDGIEASSRAGISA